MAKFIKFQADTTINLSNKHPHPAQEQSLADTHVPLTSVLIPAEHTTAITPPYPLTPSFWQTTVAIVRRKIRIQA